MVNTGAVDGVGGEEMNQAALREFDDLSGNNILLAGSATDAVGVLSAVGTGSPASYGLTAQAGSVNTGTGSAAWVAFGAAFSAAPHVICSEAVTGKTGWVLGSPIVAGSFQAVSETASAVVEYIAIGTLA